MLEIVLIMSTDKGLGEIIVHNFGHLLKKGKFKVEQVHRMAERMMRGMENLL